jgi:hypothetical protein
MIIEMRVNVIREAITGTSKLRKKELKLGRKPTTASEHNRLWMDPGKTKYDGK